MHIKSVERSSIFAEEDYVNEEHIDMQIKFRKLTGTQIQWLWSVIRKEFILDLERDYIFRVCINEKNIKLRDIGQIILPESEENSVWVKGVFRDERYKKINSFSGAEKYADARWDRYAVFDEEDKEEKSVTYTFQNRNNFESDEKFLEHICTVMKKEGIPVMSSCVFPDVEWEFQYKNEEGSYFGTLMWTLAGCALKYKYMEISELLYRFILELGNNLPELMGNVYLISGKYAGIGPAFCEELRGDIYDKYGKWPEDIFLLGSIEWLNYIPYSLLDGISENKETEDSKVLVKDGLNGRFYIIKKTISEVGIEDKKYMRKKYLDPFLMKARAILDEDIGEDSVIRSDGEEFAIFNEELQLCVKKDMDGTIIYGVEYVPISYGEII